MNRIAVLTAHLSLPAAGHRLDVTRCSQSWVGLTLLQDAWTRAQEAGIDPWEFAVEVERLWAAGLSNTELRWLLCEGHVEHAQERTGPRAARRLFHPLNSLVIPARCAFIVTARGREHLSLSPHRTTAPGRKEGEAEAAGPLPSWDGSRRQLRWKGLLIKEFRSPAANQMTILAVLEEERWPVRIDDPLPGGCGQDCKVRLHDTIKGLNRNQLVPLLRFRGDGTGHGVMWEQVEQPGALPVPCGGSAAGQRSCESRNEE